MEEYKYTCEPGHQEWTPLNSNLCMQSIKVLVLVLLVVVLVGVQVVVLVVMLVVGLLVEV